MREKTRSQISGPLCAFEMLENRWLLAGFTGSGVIGAPRGGGADPPAPNPPPPPGAPAPAAGFG